MNDLISRGDAIKAVLVSNLSACTVFGRSEEGMATAKELIQVIKNLPSVQPEHATCYLDSPCEYQNINIALPSAQQWIPCSERSPDMHDEVLVTARGEVSIAWLYVDGKWRSNDMPQPMLRDIIAWMPLPEPWKEGEADGNQH